MRMHIDVAGGDNPSFCGNRPLAGSKVNFPDAGNLATPDTHVTVEPGISCAVDQPAVMNHDIEISHYASCSLACSSPYIIGDKTTTTVPPDGCIEMRQRLHKCDKQFEGKQ